MQHLTQVLHLTLLAVNAVLVDSQFLAVVISVAVV